MAFEQKDNMDYFEIKATPATAVSKGDAEVVQDMLGFWLKDREAAGEEMSFVVYCRQVEADKATGTGEAIAAGDRVYYYPLLFTVSATATGTAGTDYYYCGWAKRAATASATTVLINFDGARYDEAV